MLKAVCPKCGKVWYGWALKYKPSVCSCEEPLNQRELDSDTYIPRHDNIIYTK